MPDRTLELGVAVALALGLTSLGAVLAIAWLAAPLPGSAPLADGPRAVRINTERGSVRLAYASGRATLEGTLERPTPCVDWRIQVSTADSARVVFDIADRNRGAICIQVLGEPQVVRAAAIAATTTWYTVRLEGQTVYAAPLASAAAR